jgi:hypothetical protein
LVSVNSCGGGVEYRSNANRRGDEKEPSAWGYNWATLFLGDINTGTWLSRLGSIESENDCAVEDQQLLQTTGPFYHQRNCYIRNGTARVLLKKMVVCLKELGASFYVTSVRRRWVCLAFSQVCISQIEHVTKNSLFSTIHESFLSTGFTEEFMYILRILCYKGSFHSHP